MQFWIFGFEIGNIRTVVVESIKKGMYINRTI